MSAPSAAPRRAPLALASCSFSLLNRGLASAATGTDADEAPLHTVPTSHPAYDGTSPLSTRHSEHALHASVCFPTASSSTSQAAIGSGLVITRVLEEGYILELRWAQLSKPSASASSTASFAPLLDSQPPNSAPRFLFPAPLLPSVGLFADPISSNFHVLATTTTGYLFKLTFALPLLFHADELPYGWAVEHRISAIAATEGLQDLVRTPTAVHAVDKGTALVACSDGCIVKVEQSAASEDDDGEGTFRESILKPTSFLSGVARFFTRSAQHSAAIDDASSPYHVLSMASHLLDDEAALAFTASRDRKLRVWDLVSEACLRTIDLPASLSSLAASSESSRELVTASPASKNASADKENVPFVLSSRPLLQAIIPSDEDHSPYGLYLLAFIPSPPPSGNFFALYGVELTGSRAASGGGLGDIVLLWEKGCDAETRGMSVELRDAKAFQRPEAAGGGWNLWTLWDKSGAVAVKDVVVGDEEDEDEPLMITGGQGGEASPEARVASGAWRSLASDSAYSPLFGPDFGASLQCVTDPADLPGFFLARIWEAGRFGTSTIEAALDAYEDAINGSLPASAFRPAALLPSATFDSNRQRMLEVVGCNVSLEHDADTGAPRHEAYMTAVRREWMRIVELLEDYEASARYPLALAAPPGDVRDAPLIVARDHLGAPYVEDASAILRRISLAAIGGRQSAFRSLSASTDKSSLVIARTELSRVSAALAQSPRSVERAIALAAASLSLTSELLAPDLEALRQTLRSTLSASLTMSVEETAEELFALSLDGRLQGAAIDRLSEALEAMGDDLEPALWELLDLLVEAPPTSHDGFARPGHVSDLTRAEPGAALAADALYQVVASRQELALALAALLVTLQTALPDFADSIASLRYLVARALTVTHAADALRLLADHDPAVDAHALATTEPEVEAGAGGGADQIVRQLGQLSVRGSGGASGSNADLETDAGTMLHRCILAGLLPVAFEDDEGPQQTHTAVQEALSSSVRHALGSSGLLDCTPQGDNWRLEAVGTLPSLRTAHATLAKSLLTLRHPRAALEYVMLWPSSPARSYIRGRVLLSLGDFDGAVEDLLSVAPLLEGETMDEDEGEDDSGLDVLLSVLPAAIFDGDEGGPSALAEYLRHVSELYSTAGSPSHTVQFGKLALQAAAIAQGSSAIAGAASRIRDVFPAATSRHLWFRVFSNQLGAGDYEGAYTTVMALPHDGLRRDCVRSLVGVMCEVGQVAALLAFPFPGLQPEIERTLSFKARNSDPLATPNYYRILYAYHMHRGDLKSAGAVMYQHAHRLAELQRRSAATPGFGGPAEVAERYIDLAVLQARSYLAAINALSLVEASNAWFADAIADEGGDESASLTTKGKAKLSSYIPDALFNPQNKRLRIVQLDDVRREYSLVLAYLELLQTYPEFAQAASTLDAQNAVLLYSRNDQFDRAFSTARALRVDATSVFATLTGKCVALGQAMRQRRRAEERDASLRHPIMRALREEADDEGLISAGDGEAQDQAELSGEASFLNLSERASRWEGAVDQRAWRYLELQLSVLDGEETHWRYHAAVLERVLSLDAAAVAPAWLWSWFKENKPDVLLRACMKSGHIDDALRHAIEMVETASRNVSPSASSTWLPYTLLDQLVLAAEDPSSRSSHGSPSATATRELSARLKKALGRRVEGLERLERERRRKVEQDGERRRVMEDRREWGA